MIIIEEEVKLSSHLLSMLEIIYQNYGIKSPTKTLFLLNLLWQLMSEDPHCQA